MTNIDKLSVGYKHYRDHHIEIKNGYSLSFEDLQITINEDLDEEYVEADICNLSDDWTPVGRIPKKYQKSFFTRMINWIIWSSIITTISYMVYMIMIKLYRE
jgi:hypothetical protein